MKTLNIPLSAPSLTDLERSYLLDAFDSGWISGTGKYVTQFGELLAKKCQRKYALPVSNGTVALVATLQALGIGQGDEVIVPALTFVAPASAVKKVGAQPILADIDPVSWCIDAGEVRRRITTRTKAIIAVDLLGHPADYDELERFGLPIIEDAAQGHGAFYKGRPTGSLGLVSTFSFHANKAISTGEGGAILTDDEELAEKLRLIINHGMTSTRPYWHEVVGSNYRMTNLTAAIGVAQMVRWDELIAARKQVACWYDQAIKSNWQTLPDMKPRNHTRDVKPATWLYTVTSSAKSVLLPHLRARGIDARGIWTALSELPLYQDAVRGTGATIAEFASKYALWLPTYAGMTETNVNTIIETIKGTR